MRRLITLAMVCACASLSGCLVLRAGEIPTGTTLTKPSLPGSLSGTSLPVPAHPLGLFRGIKRTTSRKH